MRPHVYSLAFMLLRLCGNASWCSQSEACMKLFLDFMRHSEIIALTIANNTRPRYHLEDAYYPEGIVKASHDGL